MCRYARVLFSSSDCDHGFTVGRARTGPNLKPGTMGVYVIHGLRNGLNTTEHPPSSVPGQNPAFLPMLKPFREP